MPSIYLEFEEDEMTLLTVDDEEENSEAQGYDYEYDPLESKYNDEFGGLKPEDSLIFMPVYLYRNEMDGCKKIDIDFDPTGHSILHMVVVRYTDDTGPEEISGKWYVSSVHTSRRAAHEAKKSLENGSFSGEREPWENDDCKVESIDVISLRVED